MGQLIHHHKVSFAGKVITAGVVTKGIIMGSLISILAIADFTESLILVIVSATVTGIFGLLICLIQVRAEKGIHTRMDFLEKKATEVDQTTKDIAEVVNR